MCQLLSFCVGRLLIFKQQSYPDGFLYSVVYLIILHQLPFGFLDGLGLQNCQFLYVVIAELMRFTRYFEFYMHPL